MTAHHVDCQNVMREGLLHSRADSWACISNRILGVEIMGYLKVMIKEILP